MKNIKCEKDGRKLLQFAENSGCTAKNGKGDHVIVYSPKGDSQTVIPLHKDLCKGTQHSIIKWMIKIGIIVGLFLLLDQQLFQGAIVQFLIQIGGNY